MKYCGMCNSEMTTSRCPCLFVEVDYLKFEKFFEAEAKRAGKKFSAMEHEAMKRCWRAALFSATSEAPTDTTSGDRDEVEVAIGYIRDSMRSLYKEVEHWFDLAVYDSNAPQKRSGDFLWKHRAERLEAELKDALSKKEE